MAKQKQKGQNKHERRKEKALRNAQTSRNSNNHEVINQDNNDENTRQKTSKASPKEHTTQHDLLTILPLEIFEGIFLQLDQATLLTVVQRVCRLWHRTIQCSIALQQHLFFLPVPPPNHAHNRLHSPRENPIMKHLLGSLCFQQFPINMPSFAQRNNTPALTITLFSSIYDLKDTLSKLPMADLRDGRRLNTAFLRKGSSWRRMLPSQPPPSEILHFAPTWWPSLGKHSIEPGNLRLYPTCRLSSGGSRDVMVFTVGEVYDLVYYILWGSDIPWGTSTAVSAGLLPERTMDFLKMGNTTVGTTDEGPRSRHGKAHVAVHWALFSSLGCGRDDPEFVFQKQRPSAVHLERRSSPWQRSRGNWFDPRYKDVWEYQRVRQSSMGRFKCEEYDEERTKAILKLQSDEVVLGY